MLGRMLAMLWTARAISGGSACHVREAVHADPWPLLSLSPSLASAHNQPNPAPRGCGAGVLCADPILWQPSKVTAALFPEFENSGPPTKVVLGRPPNPTAPAKPLLPLRLSLSCDCPATVLTVLFNASQGVGAALQAMAACLADWTVRTT
eukprot:1293301-Prymnesium_polylepis.1